jgi:hypothetical protein
MLLRKNLVTAAIFGVVIIALLIASICFGLNVFAPAVRILFAVVPWALLHLPVLVFIVFPVVAIPYLAWSWWSDRKKLDR